MEELPMSNTDPGELEDIVEFPRSALMTPENMMLPYDYQSFISSEFFHNICLAASSDQFMSTSSSSMPLDSDVNSLLDVVEVSDIDPTDCYQQVEAHDDQLILERDEMDLLVVKSKILHHPLFPRMLRAYAECQSKFAGDEERETSFVDDWKPWNDDISTVLGQSNPELDEFMETYCDILEKHNEDLRNTLGGVTSFLNSMEMQLAEICGAFSTTSLSGKEADEAMIPSPEDQEQQVRFDDDQTSDITNLKTSLLSKYGSGHLRDLKLEFSKRTKKKKGKLPSEARQVLVDWWCSHRSWPYPTEADKLELTRMTGLLPKQINNWFINQRKRHWKTSAESLQYSWVDNNLSAGKDPHVPDEEFDAA